MSPRMPMRRNALRLLRPAMLPQARFARFPLAHEQDSASCPQLACHRDCLSGGLSRYSHRHMYARSACAEAGYRKGEVGVTKGHGFFAELKRRNVLRVAAFYAASAWLFVQVVTQVGPVFALPPWMQRLVIVALAIALPFVLAFSWFYDLTPDGFKLDREIGEHESIARQTGKRLDRGIVAVLCLAVIALLADRISTQQGVRAFSASTRSEKSIAVLPFENLSDDKDNAYFAVGMQDQILMQLSKISGLKVISRTSTQKYKSHPEDLKSIGQELGVATVMEGSVQKSGNQARINLQLIDAASDSHLWAETYDRDMSHLFTVESEVATQVADALQAKLLPVEAKRLARVLTRNPLAYDALLRGEAAQQRAEVTWVAADIDASIASYREASEGDPQFALAYARLAYAYVWKANFFSDADTQGLLEQGRFAFQRALALAPDLAEAHVAAGFYHLWGRSDQGAGLIEFQHALALNPQDAVAQRAIGLILARQGRLDDAVAAFEHALTLDPRNVETLIPLAHAHADQHRYDLADQTLARALAIDPTAAWAWGERDDLKYLATGDADKMLAMTNAAPHDVLANPNYLFQRVIALRYKRDYDGVRRLLSASTGAAAVSAADACVWRADNEWAAGNHALAHTVYLSCALLLQAQIADADDAGLHGELGWVLARLGRTADALREGQRGVHLRPIDQDWTGGAYALLQMGRIHAELGQIDEAVAILDELLASPHGRVVSAASLAHDPDWDAIRKDPKFVAMLQRHRKSGAN